MPDDVRVQGELEQPALRVGGVELVAPHLEERPRRRVGPQRAVAFHHQVRSVVADPLDRDLHDAGGPSVGDQLVRLVVGHQRRVVDQAELLDDGEGVVGEIPARRADTDRPDPAQLLQRRHCTGGQVELVLAGEQHVALVDPAVHADLVPGCDVRLHLVRVQQRGHGGHEEAGGHPVFGEQPQDLGHRDPRAVLPLRELAGPRLTVAQRDRFVVRVEGDRHRRPGLARPARWRQSGTGPDAPHRTAPRRLVPLPRLGIPARVGHRGPPSSPAGTQARLRVRACSVRSAAWTPGRAPTTAVM